MKAATFKLVFCVDHWVHWLKDEVQSSDNNYHSLRAWIGMVCTELKVQTNRLTSLICLWLFVWFVCIIYTRCGCHSLLIHKSENTNTHSLLVIFLSNSWLLLEWFSIKFAVGSCFRLCWLFFLLVHWNCSFYLLKLQSIN